MENQPTTNDIYLQIFDEFVILMSKFSLDTSTKDRIGNGLLDVMYKEMNMNKELRCG